MTTRVSMIANLSVESLNEDIPEKDSPIVTPTSQNRHSQSLSAEWSPSPSSNDTPLRRFRRLSATPSTHATSTQATLDDQRISFAIREPLREKSVTTLSSLSDYNGSEASHTERRFIRHWEELETHSTGIPLKKSR
jgi:hypothetical protein